MANISDKNRLMEELFGSDDDDDNDVDTSNIDISTRNGQMEASFQEILPNFTEKSKAIVKHHSCAGGRGVFANLRLSAGELVVIEKPTLRWENFDINDEEALRRLITLVISDADAYKVSKILYPSHVSDLRSEELHDSANLLSVESISELSACLNVESSEIWRVVLVLKHNGFESGLYQALTMINHSCSPNCIKFPPSTSSSNFSEVWTTREISEGEELTIDYCGSDVIMFEQRSQYLQKQHFFTCHCPRCCNPKLVDGTSSSIESNIWTLVEEIQNDLDMLLTSKSHDIKECLENLRNMLLDDPDLEIATKRVDMKTALYSLLIGISRREIEIIESDQSSNMDSNYMIHPLACFLSSNLQMLALKETFMGADHCDLATYHFDIANGLSAVKSYPDTLKIMHDQYSLHFKSRDLREKVCYHFHHGNRLRKMYSTRLRFSQCSSYSLDVGWLTKSI